MNQPVQAPRGGFTIGVSCPGCGAEVQLGDNFFVLSCAHCGSVLRVRMPDVPPAYFVRPLKTKQEIRFLLDHHCRTQGIPLPPSTTPFQLFLYPYWRIDAVTLKVRTSTYEADAGNEEDPEDVRTEDRNITTISLVPYMTSSPAGAIYPGIPFSLGMRPGYLHTIPFVNTTVDADATCIPVTKALAETIQAASKMAVSLGQMGQTGASRNETRMFAPRGSIIYLPYFVADTYGNGICTRFVSDGVTGHVVGMEILQEGETSAPEPVIEFGALRLELHRCTNCAVDLPMTRSSVYQCHNCQHIEFFESHPLLSRELSIVSGHYAQEDVLFPFWSLHVADAQLPRAFFGGINPTDRLIIPAFELRNIEAAYRLTKRMTTASSHLALKPLADLDKSHMPVSRSLSEALTLLEVLWYREMVDRDIGRRAAFQPPSLKEIHLFFAPFHEDRYFFIDSSNGAVTFEKAGTLAPSV